MKQIVVEHKLTYEDGYREGLATRSLRPQRVERCQLNEIDATVRRLNQAGYEVTAVAAVDSRLVLIATARTA